MIKDPIVEEVHRTRERLLQQYGSAEDLRAQWRAIETEFKDRVVRLTPKPPATQEPKIS